MCAKYLNWSAGSGATFNLKEYFSSDVLDREFRKNAEITRMLEDAGAKE